MDIDQILGGVSPLKARSGKHARAATSTASKRGGYSKSTSSSNRGGYNRHTRFQADKWTPPPSGGDIDPVASTSAPVATAPYSGGTTNYKFGDDNSIDNSINDNRQDKSVNTQTSEITNPQNTQVETKPIPTGGETTETTETTTEEKVKKEDECKRPGFGELCKGKKEGTEVPYTDSCGKSHMMKCSWKTTTKKEEVVKINPQVAPVTTNQITNNVNQEMNRNSLLTAPSPTDKKKV